MACERKMTDMAWDVSGKRLPGGNGMLNENYSEGYRQEMSDNLGTGKA